MKTRTISFIISILVVSSLIFVFQKKLSCQTSQLASNNKVEAGKSRVSISDPEVFPADGPMFGEMWAAPEYILLDYVPEEIQRYQAKQPVITE